MEELNIFQTETLLTPTQLIFVNLNDNFYEGNEENQHQHKKIKKDNILENNNYGKQISDIISNFQETGQDFIDYISFFDEIKDKTIWKLKDETLLKQKYIDTIRPLILKKISTIYQKKIEEDNTKGRLIIFFFANTENATSLFFQKEIPIDISNLCYWKIGYFPGIFRIIFGANNDLLQNFQSFSDYYYFSELKNQKKNHFDSIFYFSNFQIVKKFLEEIIPLHIQEYEYAKSHFSHFSNSGTTLFFEEFFNQKYFYSGIIDNKSSGKKYSWKKLDWLSCANFYFFPRIWNFIYSQEIEKILKILNYQESEFRQGISEIGTSFPTLLKKSLSLLIRDENEDLILGGNLKKKQNNNQNKNQNNNQNKNKNNNQNKNKNNNQNKNKNNNNNNNNKNKNENYDCNDYFFLEKNRFKNNNNFEWRYSKRDFTTLSEILNFLQKEKDYESCNDLIEKIWKEKKIIKNQNGNNEIPIIIYKFKSMILTKLNSNDSLKSWSKYRKKLELNNNNFSKIPHQPHQLLKFSKNLSEVANASFQEKNFEKSSQYSFEFLKIFPDNLFVGKILVWTSQLGGITSKEKEEMIFRWFLNILKNYKQAEEYYNTVTAKFPKRYEYFFFYSIFLSSIKKEYAKSIEYLKKTHQLIPEDAQVLGLIATSLQLFNSKKENQQKEYPKNENLKEYSKNENLKEYPENENLKEYLENKKRKENENLNEKNENLKEILEIYEKSLKIDPKNSVNLTNYCGFLLENWPNDKKYSQIAFKTLDKLLFSEDFISFEPSLAVECWFLVLIFYPSWKISESLENIKLSLLKGGRSFGWDFSNHLNFAKSKTEKGKLVFPIKSKKETDITFSFLIELSKVITGKSSIESLKRFKIWNNVSTDEIQTSLPQNPKPKNIFENIFSSYTNSEYLEINHHKEKNHIQTENQTQSEKENILKSPNNQKINISPNNQKKNILNEEKRKNKSPKHPLFEPILLISPDRNSLNRSLSDTSFSNLTTPIISVKKRKVRQNNLLEGSKTKIFTFDDIDSEDEIEIQSGNFINQRINSKPEKNEQKENEKEKITEGKVEEKKLKKEKEKEKKNLVQKSKEPFFCEICNSGFRTNPIYQRHLKSQKHKKKEENFVPLKEKKDKRGIEDLLLDAQSIIKSPLKMRQNNTPQKNYKNPFVYEEEDF